MVSGVIVYANLLNITVFFVVMIALGVRRGSWKYRWEQPKNIGLVCLAVGALMKSTVAGWLLRGELHCIHGFNILLGHAFIICGIGAIVYSAEHKMRSDEEMRGWATTYVVTPSIVGIVTMVALFLRGEWRALSTTDLARSLSQDTAYWTVYGLIVVYLLFLGARALKDLTCDPPSRYGAGIYLVAVTLALLTAVCRSTMLITDFPQVVDSILTMLTIATDGAAISIFAIGAAIMWRQTQKCGEDHIG